MLARTFSPDTHDRGCKSSSDTELEGGAVTGTEREPRAVRSWPSMTMSTAIILSGLILTDLTLPSGDAVSVFSVAAIGVGVSLSFAIAIETRSGLYSVIRADILMLVALYALTLLEFLFPQPDLGAVVSAATARNGTEAVLLGFAGLAIGDRKRVV